MKQMPDQFNTNDEDEEYTKQQILADLREALHDAITGNTLPASALWDDIDAE
jgi:hypothetical protein